MGRYAGPGYPFGPEPQTVLGPKEDISVIYSSIANILTTEVGTVPYNPALGSFVPLLLFDINDEITRQLIRYYTVKDLTEQEPRIVVVACYTEQPDDYTVVVMVGFQLVGDPAGQTYSAPVVFPREG